MDNLFDDFEEFQRQCDPVYDQQVQNEQTTPQYRLDDIQGFALHFAQLLNLYYQAIVGETAAQFYNREDQHFEIDSDASFTFTLPGERFP